MTRTGLKRIHPIGLSEDEGGKENLNFKRVLVSVLMFLPIIVAIYFQTLKFKENKLDYKRKASLPQQQGKTLINVPDVKGLSREEAIEVLEEVGFKTKVAFMRTPKKIYEDRYDKVIAQDPDKGQRDFTGGTVEINVYRPER